jgi:hypothetical protein
MPFTDAELAAAMRDELVNSGVMTNKQQGLLLKNKTAENYVRETLSEGQLNKFADYWEALDVWMASKGGNLKNTTGANVPGRDGGNPVGIGIVPIYNDAFRDVNKYIGSEDFSPVKAVSNHLRFVSVLGGDGDDSAKSCCIIS